MDIILAGADLREATIWGMIAGAAGGAMLCVSSVWWRKWAVKAVKAVRKGISKLTHHGGNDAHP